MIEWREGNLDSQKKVPVEKKKRKFQLPHIYVILFTLSAIAAIATYLVPAGQYERIPGPNGRETIDPTSFELVEKTPVSITDFMLAFPKGLLSAGEIVFFTFVIGGMFMVLRKTGIIEISVDKLSRRFSKRSIFIIPVLLSIFALVSALIGVPELSLVYIPVILPLMIMLGYDSMVAAAIALIGTGVGYTAGVLTPANTGIAQQVSDVELFSGAGYRVVILIISVIVAVIYTMRYAKKVKNDPTLSIVYEDDLEKRKLYERGDISEERSMNTRQKLASVVALAFFGILIYGVLNLGWFMVEMSGLFIFMGIAVGLIAGLSTLQVSEAFNEGFRDVLVGAMIVGVARSVSVVLENGNIMDTIVHSLGLLVGEFPPVLGAVGMYLVQLLLNFIIPSGSGQALVTMPIMAPLSDIIGVTRQTAILAFQLGDGFSHILYPTSGYFMAALALAGVTWQKWVRFFLPLFLIFAGLSITYLVIAQLTQWTG
ncbi:YfcC family protein [Sporosarcina luteola]|uniref:YfcC family protein n=1 Tax=Sporosarcina luteola TaxID=582850 RepID=UPI00203B8F9D|nr:TIGR00366 family protein [Sporosarcina luteola]MCM3712282.1 TIGR00366 family protein [Sporosarcina luteola]